jgi:hypothetical protein
MGRPSAAQPEGERATWSWSRATWSWSRTTRAEAGAGTVAGAGRTNRKPARALSFMLLLTVSSVYFDPCHLFLIRELFRTRQLQGFAIPGVIPPTGGLAKRQGF